MTIDLTQWELDPPTGVGFKACRIKDGDTQVEPTTLTLKPGKQKTVELRFPYDNSFESGLRFIVRGIEVQSKPLSCKSPRES